MYENHSPRSAERNDAARIAVLLKSLERESLGFECRVKDMPFVPSDLKAGLKTFQEHCGHIDALLGFDSETNSTRHVCYMAAKELSGEWRAIQHFVLGDDQSADSIKVNVRQNALDVFVSPLFSTCQIPDMRRLEVSTPQFVNASHLLLVCYLVTDGGSATDGYQNVYSFRDPKGATANVLCDAFQIEWADGKKRQQALDVIRNVVSQVRPSFESYHVLWRVPPDSVAAADADMQVLRALSMQFQREWADQDQLYIKRQGLLLSLSHEYKNALKETDWENVTNELRETTTPSDFEALRGRLIRTLGRMIWPQSLALAIRAFTDAIRNPSRLRDDFLDAAKLASLKGRENDYYADAAKSYEASIQYIIHYIASVTSSLDRYLPRIAKLVADVNEAPVDMAILTPLQQPFDQSCLIFPPLKGEAARFFMASFITEPVRNALKYFVDNRMTDGVLAWGAYQDGPKVRFAISNSLLPKTTSPPKTESLDLLREIGETTKIASVRPPLMASYGGRPFFRVHIDFHPHSLETIQ